MGGRLIGTSAVALENYFARTRCLAGARSNPVRASSQSSCHKSFENQIKVADGKLFSNLAQKFFSCQFAKLSNRISRGCSVIERKMIARLETSVQIFVALEFWEFFQLLRQQKQEKLIKITFLGFWVESRPTFFIFSFCHKIMVALLTCNLKSLKLMHFGVELK